MLTLDIMYAIVILDMYSSKDFLQAGIAAPVVILLIAAVIGVGKEGDKILIRYGN